MSSGRCDPCGYNKGMHNAATGQVKVLQQWAKPADRTYMQGARTLRAITSSPCLLYTSDAADE